MDLAEERITPVGKHVRLLPDGQVPTRAQRVGGPPVPDPRIDPLPGGSREHQADRLLRPPVLEPPLHHLDVEPGQVPPRHRGQFPAQLHAGDPESAPRQRQRRLPRGASDLNQPIPGPQAGEGDQVLEQRFRVIRPRPMVALGGLVERFPQPLPLIIRSHPGQYAIGADASFQRRVPRPGLPSRLTPLTPPRRQQPAAPPPGRTMKKWRRARE
jgi:hypothetical protein